MQQAAAPPYKVFAKMTIRTKICCTTYKNICTYQKKVVPLQHEKVNKVSSICSDCVDCCTNYHIINLLYSGKFTNVNFTYSKLAKSLHLKISAKVIKKLNTNKLNYKIMAKIIKMDMFTLIPTNDGVLWEFTNAIEKAAFIQTRDARGYEMRPNCARLHLYMVIDTEGSGWCLTPKGGVTLEEAKRLIRQYL